MYVECMQSNKKFCDNTAEFFVDVIYSYSYFDLASGKYGLNIQCPWRLTLENRIMVASGDFYLPRTGLSDEAFEWDNLGANRFDERIGVFKKGLESNVVVSEVSADELGGLKVGRELDWSYSQMILLKMSSGYLSCLEEKANTL